MRQSSRLLQLPALNRVGEAVKLPLHLVGTACLPCVQRGVAVGYCAAANQPAGLNRAGRAVKLPLALFQGSAYMQHASSLYQVLSNDDMSFQGVLAAEPLTCVAEGFVYREEGPGA